MAMRTLLVGLGGTGCRIVDRVAGMIKESQVPDQYIRCIGMDTDTGDSGKIQNIDIITTSKEQTVEEYLKHTKNWREWFPDSSYIKAHNMLEGAGQMRPLSRLAFLESSQSRFGKLKDAIGDLNLARGNVEPSNMRVMIVSSFAGGTGSGMFLHAASWIRKFFRDNYHGEVLIRGLFAFPDMYMPSTSDPTQRQSKYANAYGAIRELNAINMVALDKSEKAKRINISFDGLFDSERDRGRAKMMPFDLMFFVDDLNIVRRKLPDLTHYEKLMANITYMQVYSPLSTRQYTAEDNRFITIMESGGEALYGSAGASTLEYPYQDIVDYCGLRATADSISSSWTLFDDEYRKAFNENKEARKHDPSIPVLKRDVHYIRQVQSLFDDDPGQFRFMLHQVMDEFNGRMTQREVPYFSRISGLIGKRISGNRLVELAKANCEVNKENINDPSEIVNHVSAIEHSLLALQETIDQAVTNDKGSLIQAIICDAYELIRTFNNGEFNVLTLLKKNDNSIHPLSARLLLYRLRQLVAKELEAAENKLAQCIRATDTYRKIDWYKKTREIQENPQAAAGIVAEKFGGKLNPEYRDFRDRYTRESKKQRENLEAYFNSSMTKAVFSEVMSRLTILINEYELFFDSLPTIQRSLQADVEALEVKHETDTDLSYYVHASKTAKRQIFRSLNVQVSNEDNHEVSEAIFRSFYNETCVEIERKRKITDDDLTDEERAAETLKTMEELFRDNVVTYTTKQVAEENDAILNINAYAALKLHCAETPPKEGKTLTPQDVFAQVAVKGAPYLMYNTQGEIDSGTLDVESGEFSDRDNYTYSLVFWGFNPKVAQDILQDNPSLNGVLRSYFANIGNAGIVPFDEQHQRFSPYKVEYYQSSYGIALRDILKFTETGADAGVFYKNYQERINKMVSKDEKAITPHLSIHWHLRQNLPYINEEKDSADDVRVAQALWFALAYRSISLREDSKGGLLFTSKLVDATGTPIMWDGERLLPNNAYQLYLALKDDERAIRMALAIKDKDYAAELRKAKNGSVDGLKFIAGLISADKPEQNAAVLLCHVAFDPDKPSEEYAVLKDTVEDLVEEICSKISSDEVVIADAVAKVKKDIISASGILEKGSNSREYDLFSDWL
jgi:hypothetical protein